MRYLLPVLLLATPALADPRTDCPAVGKACKVLVLTEEEQNVLMSEKGILATAAAARSLDLGGLVTYFQQKIATAPAGDVKEPAKPTESTAPAAPVGSLNGPTGALDNPPKRPPESVVIKGAK